MNKLMIVTDDGPVTERLFEGTLVIGSGEGSDVRLRDPDVSERHARVFMQRGEVWLADLGSRTGVFLHGCRISEPTPMGSDLFSIGHYRLFVVSARAQPEAPQQAFGCGAAAPTRVAVADEIPWRQSQPGSDGDTARC